MKTGTKLNLGCGRLKDAEYINIDWDKSFDPDIVHNLNSLPYPIKESSCDYIRAFHILEHLDRPFDVMREANRILKPGGIIHIKTPHFSRGFTHSEHTHGFDVTFPMYFRKDFLGSGFTGVEFKLEKLELHWSAFSCLFPNFGFGKISIITVRILNSIFSFLAKLNPYFCSRVWCFWVGGFEEIEYVFSCVKAPPHAQK